MKEHIGICESCDKPLYSGDKGHLCADGPYLCEEHSPTVADLIRQYEEAHEAGELPDEFDTEEEFLQAIADLRLDDPERVLIHEL